MKMETAPETAEFSLCFLRLGPRVPGSSGFPLHCCHRHGDPSGTARSGCAKSSAAVFQVIQHHSAASIRVLEDGISTGGSSGG